MRDSTTFPILLKIMAKIIKFKNKVENKHAGRYNFIIVL